MKLVIVESPTKAKTISKFLGKGFAVESSYGHVRDLPKSKLGVDIEHNFEPEYVIPKKAAKTVTALKKRAKESDSVILATDEDREGEAIAWHLAKILGLDGGADRIVFHEITESAIAEALAHPRKLEKHLVDAQQARRVLDRLVGYKLSPFLWKKVAKGLSAGRVQSVAVRLIVEREEEIKKFKSEEYWSIIGEFAKKGSVAFSAALAKIDGAPLEKFAIKNKAEAETLRGKLTTAAYSVSEIERKEYKKTPHPPFITSTLQQEAVKRFGFSAKRTMTLAQILYEHGHITYMRTDSVNLSKEATGVAKKWLEKNFGAAYAAAAPRVFTGKSRLAQEAHEAIRPTHLDTTAESLPIDDAGVKRLYTLIWQRFLASQMPVARIAVTTAKIAGDTDAKKGAFEFRTSGQEILFDGFLKVWPQKLEEKELPAIAESDALDLKKVVPAQHFTEPPPRFSEASLIKTLEEFGIGRPSTYASIISVIQARNYVIKEKGRFQPTETGLMVNKVLTEHFPNIVDIGFTAEMEESLDRIVEDKNDWREVIRKFYEPFEKNLEEKYKEVEKAVVDEATNEVCEKCGKPMVIKFGRFGKFLACSGFPDCKNAKPLAKDAPKPTGIKCPDCLIDLARKENPGEIVAKRVNRGRARGKTFWGCSRYPECTFATWDDPTKILPMPSLEKKPPAKKRKVKEIKNAG